MFLPVLTEPSEADFLLKSDRLSGFSDMGLLQEPHPFSQQAGKAAGHTDAIYLAASSADTRLRGPSARPV